MNKFSNDGAAIKAINEIYHDLEAEYYALRHPEIYLEERAAWEKIGETFLTNKKNLTVLDIGTGAGFVPLLLSRFLKEGDKIICTDLSEKMLEIAEKNLISLDRIKKEFVKADALEISNKNLKVDVITMNSVLHHIPDYDLVLSGLSRLLNKDGLFIIAHERNKLYSQNKSIIVAFFRNFINAKKLCKKLAKKALLAFGIFKNKFSLGLEFNKKVSLLINERGFFKHPLTIEDINAIVDIHDPDEKGDGFDPFELHKNDFPGFEIVFLETYKHLGAWVDENECFINKFLSKKVKKDHFEKGALFRLIMKKTAQ